MVPTDELRIALQSNRPALARLLKETLVHIYPRVTIEVIRKNGNGGDATLFVIDTLAFPSGDLERLLTDLPDIPALLIVPQLTQARSLKNHITGRREIITEKDLDGMALIHVVHHLLERQQLHEQIQKTAHRLHEISIRDELTKLFNHRHFNDLLVQEVKKANRYRRPLAVVMVAIKNLVAINEGLGHNEGDRLLLKAAGLLCETVREVDIVARYGDNVFAVILPESDSPAAERAAERIHIALRPLGLAATDGGFGAVVCMGIGALSDDAQSKEDLLRVALGALAEAKRNGAGGICTATDPKTRRAELTENRPLIERLHDQLTALGQEAERQFFTALMKTLGEFPYHKKFLIPHAERVAFFAERLASKVGLVNGDSRFIRRAGLLHDAGKLAIDPQLLGKIEPLTAPERELIRRHPVIAVEMFSDQPFLEAELEAIRHHHERFDGSGYPDGLAGEQIPLASRVLALTEAWDAMVSPQPYRRDPFSLDAALKELKKGAGTQFDPKLVNHFDTLIAG